jgi:hypothetical protein
MGAEITRTVTLGLGDIWSQSVRPSILKEPMRKIAAEGLAAFTVVQPDKTIRGLICRIIWKDYCLVCDNPTPDPTGNATL